MGALVSIPLGAASAAAAGCCGACCGSCMKSGTVSSPAVSKRMFAGLQGIMAVLTLVNYHHGHEMWRWIHVGINGCNSGEATRAEFQGDTDLCWDLMAGWRMQSALFFSLLVWLVASFFGPIGAGFALGRLWALKFVGPVVIFFLFLLLPNSMFWGLEQMASVCAMLCFALVGILVMDVGVRWNTLWVGNILEDQRAAIDANAGRQWRIAIIAFSAVFAGLAVSITIFMWTRFHAGAQVAVTVINLLLALAAVGGSMLNFNHMSLLSGSLMACYLVWGTWTSMYSYPIEAVMYSYPIEDVVTAGADGHRKVVTRLVTQAGLARFGSFCFVSLALASYVRDPSVLSISQDPELLEALAARDEAADVAEGQARDAAEFGREAEEGRAQARGNAAIAGLGATPDAAGSRTLPQPVKSTAAFFVVHVMACMYIGVLLMQVTGKLAFWGQLTGVWLAAAAYFWAMFAPMVVSDRQF